MRMLLAVLLLSFNLSNQATAVCDDPPKPKARTVHKTKIVYDTVRVHVPLVVFDTLKIPQSPEVQKQPQPILVTVNLTNFLAPQALSQQVLPASQPPLPAPILPEDPNDNEEQPLISFHPFLEAGLHAEPHLPATWYAGLGIELAKGGFYLECAATLEPETYVPEPAIASEAQALTAIETRTKIATVVYGSLRYLF